MFVASKILQKQATSTIIKKPPFLVITAIGNPEAQYRNTRHNAGMTIIDLLKHSPFVKHPEYKNVEIAMDLEKPNCIFIKTHNQFMNVSGVPLKPIWKQISSAKSSKYDVKFIVLHDELDKEVGKIQVRYGNVSCRGHNGLKSIVEKNGTDFYRIGVGISRPLNSRDPRDVARYVLKRIPDDDIETLHWDVLPQVEKVLEELGSSPQ